MFPRLQQEVDHCRKQQPYEIQAGSRQDRLAMAMEQAETLTDAAELEAQDQLLTAETMEAGLEKTRVFKKKTNPVGFLGFWFFLLGFWGFLGFFWFFLGFLYICPEERVFRVFSVSRILLGASRL
jgi:hypothetical protein